VPLDCLAFPCHLDSSYKMTAHPTPPLPPSLPPQTTAQVVLTKCDLVDRVELVRRVTQLRQELADLNLPRAAGRLPVVMLRYYCN
jgi:hypothetical protein